MGWWVVGWVRLGRLVWCAYQLPHVLLSIAFAIGVADSKPGGEAKCTCGWFVRSCPRRQHQICSRCRSSVSQLSSLDP